MITTENKWAREKDAELKPILDAIVSSERQRWAALKRETWAVDDYLHVHWQKLTKISLEQQGLCQKAAIIIDTDNPMSWMAEFSKSLFRFNKERDYPACTALLLISGQVSHISAVIPVSFGLSSAVGVVAVALKIWEGDPMAGSDGRFRCISSIGNWWGENRYKTTANEDEVNEVLLELAEHPDPDVRLAVLEARKRIGGKLTTELLIRYAFDQSEFVSCEALKQISDVFGKSCYGHQLFGDSRPITTQEAQRLLTLCLDAMVSGSEKLRTVAIEVLDKLISGDDPLVSPSSSSDLARLKSAYHAEAVVWMRHRISEVIQRYDPSATEYWSEVFHRRTLDGTFLWKLRGHLKALESPECSQERLFVKQHLEELWRGDRSSQVRKDAGQLLDEMGVKPGNWLQRAIRKVKP